MAAYAAKIYDFDIESFEMNSSAAPKREQEIKKVPLRKVAPRTREDLLREELTGLKKAVALLSLVLVVFGVVALQLSASAESYALSREIQAIERQLDIERSENIRLTSELNGITGISVIDSYATEVLGMTKVENYQIECIDLSGGDAVLYSSSFSGD